MRLNLKFYIISLFLIISESAFLQNQLEDEVNPVKESEFLIRLKIPETLSHLFTSSEDDSRKEISLKNLINNNFWKENIINEILSTTANKNNINFLKKKTSMKLQISEDGEKEKTDLINSYSAPDNTTIEEHFEKLVELQKVLKNIDILQHIHFNGFEAIKTTLDPELFNELKLNPFVADIDTNEQFQAFSVIPKQKSLNHDFKEYEEEEEEDDDDDLDDDDDNDKENKDHGNGDKDNNGIAIQYTAPRHLARLSRRSKLSLDDNSNLNYYYQNKFTGKDVSVYILDTGIAANHPQLQGRVRHGESFVNEPSGDFNGHGSHVAGIVGSKDYGVCKSCELVEVKCLNKNGQGDLTTVISAIEFAVGDMIKTGKKSVANLSLGSFRSKILNEAVKAAVDNGMVMVVAAGNSNMNACLNSPASEPAAITVGAIDDKNDQIASFSNWGECVDIFASGVKVESLSFSDFDNPVKFSGTSMATPSVAGLAAILLDMGVKNDQIKDKLIAFSSKDFIKRRHLLMRPRTPNRLLFNGVSSAENEDYKQEINDSDKDHLFYEVDKEALYDEELHISDVPIEEKLAKREIWIEPSFISLQKLIEFD